MNDFSVAAQYAALAQECERQAREAERLAISPDLSEAERIHQIDRAKILWQLRGDHIETAMRQDAARGRKIVANSDSTRKATDADRRAIVELIIAERGKGKRDAFRIAAQRFRYMGGESAFKTSYYKKASKRGQ